MDPVGTITWNEDVHMWGKQKPHEVEEPFLSEIAPDTYNGLQALSTKLLYMQSSELQNH